MTIPKKVQDFAGEMSYGHLEPHGTWEGFDVYAVVLEEPMCLGYPQVVLTNSRKIRWATPDEALEIICRDD